LVYRVSPGKAATTWATALAMQMDQKFDGDLEQVLDE